MIRRKTGFAAAAVALPWVVRAAPGVGDQEVRVGQDKVFGRCHRSVAPVPVGHDGRVGR